MEMKMGLEHLRSLLNRRRIS